MSTRRFVLISAALLPIILAGCGFRPLYGQREAGTNAALSKVRVDLIPNRVGQELRIRLQDAFDPTGSQPNKAYGLTVRLVTSTYSTSIRSDDTPSRNNFDVRAYFTLIDLATRKPVLDSNAHAITSYNVLRSDYATASAETDARTRAVTELTAAIQTRLAVFFDQRARTASADAAR